MHTTCKLRHRLKKNIYLRSIEMRTESCFYRISLICVAMHVYDILSEFGHSLIRLLHLVIQYLILISTVAAKSDGFSAGVYQY